MPGLRGKVESIGLKNFVTYNSVQFTPGPCLNVITGPNGTGKSSIVAGIVLGMGGSPKVLSRALNIGDYVKNGEKIAIIEIGIYRSASDPDDVIRFRREIDVAGLSRFYMDDRKCTHADYMNAVHGLNIHVDNLCQFLPQDRVQDFAKQNPRELLASTQSSVCAPEVEQTFQSLKEMRQRQLSEHGSRAHNVARLADAERQNTALEPKIETMQRRRQLQLDHNVCAQKLGWIRFEEMYVKYQELADERLKADDELKRHDDALQPLQQQLDAMAGAKADYERLIADAATTIDARTAELERLAVSTGDVPARMRRQLAEFDSARESNAERERELKTLSSLHLVLIADLQAQVVAAGSDEQRRAELADLDRQLDAQRTAERRLTGERHAICDQLHATVQPQLRIAETRIRTVQSIGDRKLELLRSRFEDAYRGVLWLRQNKQMFSGRVYEPMVLELNVIDQRNAKYIESHVSVRDLIAFTCERKDDMELMHRMLRREQHLNVNLIHSAPAERVTYQSQRPIAELVRFGFRAYLIDLIEGPAPLLNALCQSYQLHQVPVGDDRTFEMSDKLPAYIRRYYSTSHSFRITNSRYSKVTSSACTEIHGANLLNIGVDRAELQRQQEMHARLLRQSDALKNERVRLDSELGQLEETSAQLRASRAAHLAKVQALKVCSEKVTRHAAKIKRLPAIVKINEDRHRESIRALWLEALQLQASALPLHRALCTARRAHHLQRVRLTKFLHTNRALHGQLQQHRDNVDRAARLVERIREQQKRLGGQVRDQKAAALQLTDGRMPSEDPYRERFAGLPAVLEELTEHMNELQGEIDCLDGDGSGGDNGESVFAEYEKRKRHIEQLNEAIGRHAEQNDVLERQMDELQDKWLPIVQSTVDVINATFARYMSAMRYAGEVVLTHGDRRDYAEYGVEIRVKYRSEERLQRLDRNVQSGGERAVAIAVYSLALQQISNVPFRCVDELNQGMDATNERKIFEMLVEQTNGPDKSQYFFVTPKLLPDLAYNEYMTVHAVHNGRYVRDERLFERKLV